MTFESLLGRSATITHRSQSGVVGRYNVADWVENEEPDVPYARQQHAQVEDLDQRQTQIGTHRLYFLPDVDIDGSDLVTDEADGLVLEVVGPPEVVDTPAGPHHLEVTAREVDQRAASAS